MIGSLPMMAQPRIVQPPVQTYPAPRTAQPNVPPWPPRNPAPQQAQQPLPKQALPAVAQGQQQQPVQPILARAKPYMEEKPAAATPVKLAPLSLPTPQALGIAPKSASSAPANVDWNATHERLKQLGGFGMQVSQTSDGRCRVAFVLHTELANVVHHIEATGASEAEAVSAAMSQANNVSHGR